MKNLFLGILATVFSISFATAQDFEQSVAIIAKGRVANNVKTGYSAKTFEAKNFDSRYKLLSSYTIDGVDYTDDGRNFDKTANDGIYTSSQLTANPKNSLSSDLNVIVSTSFQHTTALENYAKGLVPTVKIRFRCKVKYTMSGNSSLTGIPCASLGGCVVIYDCEAEFELEW